MKRNSQAGQGQAELALALALLAVLLIAAAYFLLGPRKASHTATPTNAPISTARPESTSAASQIAALPASTPTAAPVDCMKFMRDVSIVDGTVLPAGVITDKDWQVQNCGTTTWTGYQLVIVYGAGPSPEFHTVAKGITDLPAIGPGQTGDINTLVTAPNRSGQYFILFELRSSDEIHRFGDPLWVNFVVQ